MRWQGVKVEAVSTHGEQSERLVEELASFAKKSRRRYDMSEARKSKAQSRCKALVPGGYYQLGDRVVYCASRGPELHRKESGEVIGERPWLVLYDAREFRHRDYGGFGLMRLPQRWWEVQKDGQIVLVNQTGLTTEDMQPLGEEEIDEELEALEPGPEYLMLRETRGGGEIVHICETELTLEGLKPLSEDQIGPEHRVIQKGTGHWDIKEVDGEKILSAVVEDGVWFDRK